MTIKELQRLTTGISGLDRILEGGLFETGLYIIQGSAGAGKTILANQICFHQAALGHKAIYYTLLTEAHDRMMGFIQHMEFFDAAKVATAVTYVSGYKVLEAEGLSGVVRSIRDLAARQRPSLLVVDGLVSAEEIAPNDTAFKKFLHELQMISAMFRCTIVLLTNSEGATRLQAEHTMVDGIIELQAEIVHLKSRRTLAVSKFRGSGQMRGSHTFEISNKGITVRPRIEAILGAIDAVRGAPGTAERCGFGIPGLDAMMRGGLTASSNTMLMGPSGAGKTVLGLHFLNQGVVREENGLLFTFYERKAETIAKAHRLGMKPLAEALESGKVKMVWQSSVEANIDKIGADLLSAFEEVRPSRVLLDGLHGFQATADHPERIQDFFAAMSDYFMGEGATFLFTTETVDLLGESIQPPFANASRMCQNMLVLRYSERRGQLSRVVAVVKMRDSDFDNEIREVRIGSTGLTVADVVRDADKLLVGTSRTIPGAGG